MSEAKIVLERAAALIDSPERWTKGARARAANGEWVYPASKTACQWCAGGAIQRAIHDLGGYPAWGWAGVMAADRFDMAIPSGRKRWLTGELPTASNRIAAANDHPDTEHEEVLGWFAKAIKAAEAGA